MSNSSSTLSIFLFVLFYLFCLKNNCGQISIDGVVLQGGLISHYEPYFGDEFELQFFPEIGIGGKFYNHNIDWNVLFGYYQANEKIPNWCIPIEDAISTNNFLLTALLKFHPKLAWERSGSPLIFNLGISTYFKSSRYLLNKIEDSKRWNVNDKIAVDLNAGLDILLPLKENIDFYIHSLGMIFISGFNRNDLELKFQYGAGFNYKFSRE